MWISCRIYAGEERKGWNPAGIRLESEQITGVQANGEGITNESAAVQKGPKRRKT